MRGNGLLKLVRDTVVCWQTSKVIRLAGTIAFHAAASLMALLLLVTIIGAGYLQRDEPRTVIIQAAEQITGPETADLLNNAIRDARTDIDASSPVTTIGTFLIMIYTASRLFRRLQDAINVTWEIEPHNSSAVKDVIVAVIAALIFGFALLLVLLLNGAAFTLINAMRRLWPDVALISLYQTVGAVLLFLVTAGVMAMMFRFMPNIRLPWRTVIVGGVVTALLFTAGQWALGYYIRLTNTGTYYGLAGTFIVLLLWVYVSAQIILLGAAFTHVYARQRGEVQHIDTEEPVMPHLEQQRQT